MKIKKPQKIVTIDNKVIDVLSPLGEGGQGEVYLVEYNSKKYALKIYKEEESEDFLYNLKRNIDKGSPSKCFLWPLEYININNKIFGYLMDLRPSNYVSFVSYLTAKNKFKDTSTLLNWCIDLCMSFKKLHEKGFSYQDLNDGNFFFEPDTGKLLICDNDNVTADKKNLGVLGKMRYMAPEIVRRDKNIDGTEVVPDVHSDRFSLAIILFLALCLGNPFEGEVLKKYDIIDEESDYEMYGSKPVFIYHKTNKSNRPIRGYHTSVIKRWPTLPLYLKEEFHRTFVDGLKDRENERTTEIEWIKLLTKYRDELVTCSCSNQYAYKENDSCPFCHTNKNNPCILEINKSSIVLEPNKYLYMNHLDKYSSEYNLKVAKVIVNKNNPSLWGIKLNLNEDVKIIDSVGKEKIIPKDGVIPIINNLTIEFNNEVKAIIKK